MFPLAADAVLVLHVAIVLFVVLGLVLIVVGNFARWRWINALWFRVAHLAAICVVALEAWFGIACPLTTLEIWLRREAGAVSHGGGFIAHWLSRLLYWNAPEWVFTVAYTVFGVLVIATWLAFPPRRPPRR